MHGLNIADKIGREYSLARADDLEVKDQRSRSQQAV